MANIQVNPTRMELSRLKKRLNIARRGHKLLKDKLDELMKRFLDLIRENKTLREETEEKLKNLYERFLLAKSVTGEKELLSSLSFATKKLSMNIEKKNVMSVEVPKFKMKDSIESDAVNYPYGFLATSGELDTSIEYLQKILPTLIKLAEVEKSVQLMADEIEKTRRRVNALEHVMIPQLAETIKYIKMKLDESERGNLTRLMKVKDMMLEDARRKRIKAENV
ncbi:MAG: V-type ATP synthase subunit D [Clostridiales bacterium]